jgi:hypothetical protein
LEKAVWTPPARMVSAKAAWTPPDRIALETVARRHVRLASETMARPRNPDV